MKIELKPIAYVKNSRKEISDDYWGGVISEITLADDFDESAFKGIEEFSHLEIIFYFDKVDESKIRKGAGHPRNNRDWAETGIFAQRGKNRPNQLGLSLVRLIERKDKTIYVKWLDAIDGTPILDIKPVLCEFLPEPGEEITQPNWATELMLNYWKER
jgi:tRNA-Thr(GGU) m(6)t(6)A37 methyltransferase TsaA